MPHSLYFLDDQSIWLLEPGDTVAQRITPPDRQVSSFDIWPEDNRMAYGTSDGQLYVAMPGREPRLLHDLSSETSYPIEIVSVSWSPDGTRLAYSGHYTSEQAHWEAGYPSRPSGLWVISLEEGKPIWLLSNHYMTAGTNDVGQIRVTRDAVWSPDGTAMLLNSGYWEGSDFLLFEPAAAETGEAGLRDFGEGEPALWNSGSWTGDGQAILLSGQGYAAFGDLARAERASLKSEKLIDGESAGVWVADAQDLPTGVAFLVNRDSPAGETRLYLGHLTGAGFQYAPAGPEHLCDSGSPGHVEWETTGHWGILTCDGSTSRGEVRMITLGGVNTEISSYLGPPATTTHLQVKWGK